MKTHRGLVWALAALAGAGVALRSPAAMSATLVSYVASDGPSAALDANGNTVDVWTQTNAGGSGSFFGGPAGGLPPASWYLFSFGIPAGTVRTDHTFAGGALSVGQVASIDFGNRGVLAGAAVGVALTSGGTRAITFKFVGGDADGVYRYDDAGGSGQSTGIAYVSDTSRNLKFTLTGAGTYAGSWGTDSWSGTYAGVIDGIQVFNDAGGDASDVAVNNLTVAVPEPGSLAMLGAAIAALGTVRRRR